MASYAQGSTDAWSISTVGHTGFLWPQVEGGRACRNWPIAPNAACAMKHRAARTARQLAKKKRGGVPSEPTRAILRRYTPPGRSDDAPSRRLGQPLVCDGVTGAGQGARTHTFRACPAPPHTRTARPLHADSEKRVSYRPFWPPASVRTFLGGGLSPRQNAESLISSTAKKTPHTADTSMTLCVRHGQATMTKR